MTVLISYSSLKGMHTHCVHLFFFLLWLFFFIQQVHYGIVIFKVLNVKYMNNKTWLSIFLKYMHYFM